MNMVSVFEGVDKALELLKKKRRRITCWIIVLDIVVTMIAAGLCWLALYHWKLLYLGSSILLVFKNVILVYSIVQFKAFVKTF